MPGGSLLAKAIVGNYDEDSFRSLSHLLLYKKHEV